MPRSGADARRRLREAALELYRERGFDATTTAQIAARAGVTERTYFRHFADKREVLFDGEAELRDTIVSAIEAAHSGESPLTVLSQAFIASVPLFVAGRQVAVSRQSIIDVTPALQERAHAKTAALVGSIASALPVRGMSASSAAVAAQIGMAAFRQALADWDGTSAAELERLIRTTVDEVRALD
ncbi:TetR/AcrR family transcriptional regulator [Humibacter antri]